MILADTRFHLTRDDAQLAARRRERGGAGSRNAGSRLAVSIDAILDDSCLAGVLRRDRRATHASPLRM
jgi:hypothetical protein